MKKVLHIHIMALWIMLVLGLPVWALTYEGEVVSVDSARQTLTLAKVSGGRTTFQLAPDAALYYNKAESTLSMYEPVTADDYVSGYIETNAAGLITSAHFFYLVREGSIETISETELVLKQTEGGICDSYEVSKGVKISLNNYPSDGTNLFRGMKALVILDHHYRVKKMAIFHYEYTGFIEKLDLHSQTVVVNVGTRLRPDRREFRMGGILQGLSSSWERLADEMKSKSFILAKFNIDQERNTISCAEIRSL